MIVPALLSTLAFAQTAQADPFRYDDKLCSELAQETRDINSSGQTEKPDVYDLESPRMVTLQGVMEELDNQSYWRIVQVLAENFEVACISRPNSVVQILAENGVPNEPTIGEVIDDALERQNLDRSLENWGLIAIPEIDFEVMTWRQLLEIFEEIPQEQRSDRKNDVYFLGFRKYLQKYDLGTEADFALGWDIFQQASFERHENADVPLAQVLDHIFKNEGLRLKPD